MRAAGTDSPSVVYRSGFSGAVAASILVGCLTYVAARWWSTVADLIGDHTFTVVFGLAGSTLVFGLVHRLRGGIRVDVAGLTNLRDGTSIAWDDVESVTIEAHELDHPPGAVARTALVVDAAGNRIRFGSLQSAVLPDGMRAQDLPDAPLLLATIVARARVEAMYPDGWRSTSVADDVRDAAPPEDRRTRGGRVQGRAAGALGFVVLIASKVAKIAASLGKTVKVAPAAASVAAYALVVSWPFALAFVGLILVHEFGHVYAMSRTGVRAKGIYLIPFLGGAVIARSLARTHWQNAYVAISGPVWGTACAIACFGLHHLLDRNPFVGAVAAWGAWLNLVNLLPVFPLDGGRVLTSVARSCDRGEGAVLTLGCLIASGTLAAACDYWLIMVMVGFGCIEFLSSWSTARLRSALGLLGGLRMDGRTFGGFAHRLALSREGRGRSRAEKAQVAEFESRLAEALREPMSKPQILVLVVGTLALAGFLFGIMWATRGIPGAGDPLELFR